ncbi:EamA family transporter, partial [Candidatus Woesearchaeota archaeon]|nr:EamA family transporter [Candidatus Woesearchaeota archaeon]
MLISVVCFAFVNILDKILITKHMENRLLIVFKSIFWLAILVLIPFVDFQLPSLKSVIFICIAGIPAVIAFIPYLKSLSIEEASKVVPLLQFNALATLVMSYIFLGERLSLWQVMAFFFMFGGGLMLSIKRHHKILTINKAFWLMWIAVFLWALNLVLMKQVYKTHYIWSAL